MRNDHIYMYIHIKKQITFLQTSWETFKLMWTLFYSSSSYCNLLAFYQQSWEKTKLAKFIIIWPMENHIHQEENVLVIKGHFAGIHRVYLKSTRFEPRTTWFINKHSVWLNKWLSVHYELTGCGFKSCCCHFNFRYGTCFNQGVPWNSGNYRV